MTKNIGLVAKFYDKTNGKIIEELIIIDYEIIKAKTLKYLGYLHPDQIDILKNIFLLLHIRFVKYRDAFFHHLMRCTIILSLFNGS